MTCELYINDVLCDLLYDEEVALLYQSPIFSGLDSIQSNRSYNIALPPTPTNIGAVRFAERPDIDSDVPYIRNAAALYLDGIPLFTQGVAVVTDITDTINVTLTWGNVDNFQPLFDASLRELGPQLEAAGCGHIAWNADSSLLPTNNANKYPGVAFWGINFGMGLNDPKYLHPSVQVETILSAIEQYNGITIEGKERLAYSPHLGPIIPLVTKNGDEVSGKAETAACKLSQLPLFNGYTYLKGVNPSQHSEYIGEFLFNVNGATEVNVQIAISGFYGSSKIEDREGLEIYIAPSEKYATVLAPIGFSVINEPDRLYIEAKANITLTKENIPQSGYFSIVVKHEKSIDFGGNISFTAYPRAEVHYPSVFPVAANLPDMSQGEFVLTLMTMNGLFAYADKDRPNTIRLISIDDIFARVDKGDILDWSDRVLLNDIHRVDMPDASVFTIDGLAQRNILDYDNDDDVRTDTYGMIKVHNENIEMETELAELPFSASESVTTSGVDCALIPIYESDGQGGAKYSEVTPRILSGQERVISDKSYCMGRFDPWMKFGGAEGLVKSKYASYQKVVSRLRIITVRAVLSPLDLYNLDYTRPVYIAQFGQLFAIYSVETGGDGICECQLLKLEPAYYLTLNGQSGDYTANIGTAAQTVDIPYRTNGTLVVEDQIGWFDSVDVCESSITVAVQENSLPFGRVSELILSVSEDRSIKRRLRIHQDAFVTGYYLTINGQQQGDVETACDAKAQTVRLRYETNGTLYTDYSGGDGVTAIDFKDGEIAITLSKNTMSVPWTRAIPFGVREDASLKRRILITQGAADPNEELITAVSLLCKDFASLTKTIDLDLSTAGLTGRIITNFNASGAAMLPPKNIMNAFGENAPLSKYTGDILTAVSGSYSGHRELPDSGGVIINLVKQ